MTDTNGILGVLRPWNADKIKPSGLRRAAKVHGAWLLILTTVFVLWVAISLVKDKKRNYSDLHRRVAELERRCDGLD